MANWVVLTSPVRGNKPINVNLDQAIEIEAQGSTTILHFAATTKLVVSEKAERVLELAKRSTIGNEPPVR